MASIAGAHDLQHCIHKLPTSCQLTSLPTCCACGDKRPQNLSYSRYIDGVGFCLGGKRQERYCPNCKNFWDTRIAVSGTPHSNCRIPHVPDQTDFIRQWFDWHRGYTIIRNSNGTEERHILIGEPLSEVPLGHLPQTLEESQPPPSQPPEPSRPQPRRRHRARRRLPAGLPHTVSSNNLPDVDRHIPHQIGRAHV